MKRSKEKVDRRDQKLQKGRDKEGNEKKRGLQMMDCERRMEGRRGHGGGEGNERERERGAGEGGWRETGRF